MNAPQLLAPSDAGLSCEPVLLFEIGSEVFAIPADCVREILEVPPVTRVPDAAALIDGLVNVRGAVVPLADLRTPFEMSADHSSEDTRIIVIEETFGVEREVIGILADKVSDVCLLDERAIEAPPGFGMRWRPEFVSGIGRKAGAFVIIPDIPAIFSFYMPDL